MSEHPHDETWMLVALGEAQAAAAAGDVPVGAAIVVGDHLLAVGRNRREVDQDPTAHAEMEAIRAAAKVVGSRDLSGCALVSSSRPCPMCEAAAHWAGISRMYHGQVGVDAGAPGLCR